MSSVPGWLVDERNAGATGGVGWWWPAGCFQVFEVLGVTVGGGYEGSQIQNLREDRTQTFNS